MKLIRNIVATALIAVMPLAVTASASAQTFNNSGKGCSVEETAAMSSAFTVSGNVASTTVRVKGPANCRETVSVASWNAALGSSGFVGQRFHAGKTFTLGTGPHTLSIGIDNSCTYQVDVLLGARQTSASGNAQYGPQFLMGFLQNRVGVCQGPQAPAAPAPTPTPTPAPATTTVSVCSGDTVNANDGIASQGGNCSTNTTVVKTPPTTPTTPTPTPTPTPAAPAAAQPTALVNTGPGSTLALFAVATIGGYFIHRKLTQRAFQA